MTTHPTITDAMREGRPACATVGSIIRGGYVYAGAFWYHAATNIGPQRVPLESVTDLTYHDELEATCNASS